MSQRFKLVCRCGKEHPVETSQAGRFIECACGSRLEIPSMLKIKRLPLWDGEPSSEPAESASPPADSSPLPRPAGEESPVRPRTPAPACAEKAVPAPPKRPRLPAARKGLIVAGSLGFLLFAALLVRCLLSPPQLIDVLNIQRFYLDKGKLIQRDSNPIEESDAYFFVTKDNYVINDRTIDLMTPFYAVEYFDYLKTGLSLSDNFYDKYDSLVIRRRITMVFLAGLAGISLAAAIIPLFLSKEQKTVGTARGSDWKS